MSETTPLRHVTVRLPEPLFEQLAHIADQEQRSVSNLLRVIATDYLNSRREEPPHE